MYLNKALVYGNLTRDPELKSLPSGNQVATFAIATNRTYKDKDGNRQEAVEFHNIVVFGRQAETSAQYLKKGSTALVEGRLQTRSWDGQDGQKKYRTEIVAERVQFGPRGGDGGGQAAQKEGGEAQSASAKGSGTAKQDGDESINYPDEEINPDDIPF